MTRPEKLSGLADAYGIDCRRIPGRVRPAIPVLLQAYEYACGLERDPWDFAVEVSVLQSAGIGINEVRWLIYAGLAEHALEISQADDAGRLFQRGGSGVAVTDKTCLVLSETGVDTARQLTNHSPRSLTLPECEMMPGVTDDRTPESFEQVQMPTWDADRQELRWGRRVVKRFKLPSPNQETVLAVFQEDNWPPRIDDPLPPTPAIDAKRRLNDTIKSLNRHQKYAAVRFMGDGRGMGVRWEPILGEGDRY